VVLVHGYMSDLRTAWVRRGFVDRLATTRRVIALDCRGHGKSDKPAAPEAYGPEMARDVVRLLDHLHIERAHLVGYSMGANITAQLLTSAPQRVMTGTLGGASGRIGWSEADDRLAEIESRELESGTLRSQILRLMAPGAPDPSDAQIQARSRAALRGQDRKALAAIRRANRGEAVTEEAMMAVRVPVLGVVGSLDPYVTVFRRLHRVMPTLQLVVVEGGTHRTTSGRAEFIEAVEAFLTTHPGGGPAPRN
jgi:pimeloyl-ACP methyl ester carboxylesterase